ncbi:MAG TPA: VRR-NUC domain-containing protein [Clostridiales bacterium]|nr:VRR-NUC domain-containing protein [Clostridiales bacterium]
MKTYEADEQAALFDWAEVMSKTYPELELLHHIPNGGSRHPKEAANLKRQGVKAGVPDICLPVPRCGYHGLYVEIKVKPNKPTEEQLKWLKNLYKQGYDVCICYSWFSAKTKIESYLGV